LLKFVTGRQEFSQKIDKESNIPNLGLENDTVDLGRSDEAGVASLVFITFKIH